MARSRFWKYLIWTVGGATGIYLTSAAYMVHKSKKAGAPLSFAACCYSGLPWRSLSRLGGRIAEVQLPYACRTPMLGLYGLATKCNFHEALVTDLKQYHSLQEFFSRELNHFCRPIGTKELVYPADGRVLSFGRVTSDVLTQVKHSTYNLADFLGEHGHDPDSSRNPSTADISKPVYQRLLLNENTSLYQCVLYLGPGDCHRFISPADWTVQLRRYLPGNLLSVHRIVASWFNQLFVQNERVAYIGEWKYGRFIFVAVGASNVGNIQVFMDPKLRTNQLVKYKPGDKLDKLFSSHVVPRPVPPSLVPLQPSTTPKTKQSQDSESVDNLVTGTVRLRGRGSKTDAQTSMKEPSLVRREWHIGDGLSGGESVQKADMFGRFLLGSTIVFLFEAPKDAEFAAVVGQKVKYGQSLLLERSI